MCIINIIKSSFSNKSEQIEVNSGKPIHEVVGVDLDNAIIVVDGFVKDKNYVLQDGELCTIRIFPSGNDTTQNWLDLAIFGVLTLINPVVGVAWAVGSGISWLINGKSSTAYLMEWASPDVDIPKNQQQAEDLPTIRGAQNQSLQGHPIPFIMGRHLLTPYYCGKPYMSIGGEDGEDQYITMMLMLGYSKLKVTDIKLGELLLASNKEGVMDNDKDQRIAIESGLTFYNGQIELCQSDRELNLYPQKVFDEQIQIELTNAEGQKVTAKRFSANNPHRVEVEITMPCLLAYNDKGEETEASVDIKVMYRWHTLDGSDTWKPFNRFTGCNSYTDGTSTFRKTKNKMMRFVATKEFSYDSLPKINGELAPSTMIDLQISRESSNSTDSKVRHQVYLTSVRTWTYDFRKTKDTGSIVIERPVDVSRRAVSSRLAIKLKASEDIKDTINQVNCVLESYARVWDSNSNSWSTTEQPTRNPSAIALKAMTGNILGNKRLKDTDIDLEMFGRWYEFCDDVHTDDITSINKLNTRGCVLECNGIIHSPKKFSDLLSLIMFTGRANYIRKGRLISLVIDKAQSQFVTILNNQNVTSATNTKKFDEVADGVKVSFVDEDCGWQTNTMYINYDDGSTIIKKDYNYKPVDLPYQTHRNQVWHACMFEQAKEHLRPETWSRTVSTDGNLLGLMNLVQVQDDTIVVGIGDGAEITSVEYDETRQYVTTIHTDGRFNVSDLSKEYGIKIIQADGINEPSIRVCKVTDVQTGLLKSFKLASPIHVSDNVIPSVGDIVAFGEYGKETIEAMVLGKKSNEDGTFEVTLTPYSNSIYEYEKTKVMPEFDSKINAPQKTAGVQELPPDYVSRKDMYDAIANIDIDVGGTPEIPTLSVVALENILDIDISSPTGGLSDIIAKYILEVQTHNGIRTITSNELNIEYEYDRFKDGYPEKTTLDAWKVRVKAVNVYGNESEWSEYFPVDTTQYLTWQVESTSALVDVEEKWIDWEWNPVNENIYGNIYYDLMAGDRVLATCQTNTYRYWFDRGLDGYPEKADILRWGLKVRARNEATQVDDVLEELDIDMSNYKTWVPTAIPLTAVAFEERIDIEWEDPVDVYGSWTYDIIVNDRVDGRTTANYHPYNFNRVRDGFPEKVDLALWDCKLKISNEAHSLLMDFAIDTSYYQTWIPVIENVKVIPEADYIQFTWTDNQDDCYGIFRFTIKRDGVEVKENISFNPVNLAYNREIDGYPEKDWFTHTYTVTVDNEAHEVTTNGVVADTSNYKTWIIKEPVANGIAKEGELDLSWQAKPKRNEEGYYYGEPLYSIVVDGVEVITGLQDILYRWLFNPQDKGFPESTDIDGWNVTLRITTEAQSIEVPIDIDTSKYLGYTPKQAPVMQASANGRLINVSWNKDTEVYGYLGGAVQVAKAYKVVDGVYTPIVDENELQWLKPALGQNPYVSEDNYQDGQGSLDIDKEQVSLLVPLYGQSVAPEPETMYAYRVATRTVKTNSAWSDIKYVIAKPVSAMDVVKAWNIKDTGEKVKVDGALGANQIYVNELAAISANLGFITDGMIAGSELNYWAINDVVDPETGAITRFRGEWRVGDEDEYIVVSIKTDEQGNPIPGRFKIKLAAGEYVVFAGDTEIHGKTFTFYDTEGNIIFQITPEKSYIAVQTGDYRAKGLYQELLHKDMFYITSSYSNSQYVFEYEGWIYYKSYYISDLGFTECGWFRRQKDVVERLETWPSNLNLYGMSSSSHFNGRQLYIHFATEFKQPYSIEGNVTVTGQIIGFMAMYDALQSDKVLYSTINDNGEYQVFARLPFTDGEGVGSFKSIGDGNFYREEDTNLRIHKPLEGTELLLRISYNPSSVTYVGNHHIYVKPSSDSGFFSQIWDLDVGEKLDVTLNEGDTPVYVVQADFIYAKDESGAFWKYQNGVRTSYTIEGDPSGFTAEMYGQGVWYLHDGYVIWWNVLDGTITKSVQLNYSGTYYKIIPTDNYLLVTETVDTSFYILPKNNLSRYSEIAPLTIDGSQPMPIQGDKIVSEGASGNLPSKQVHQINDDGTTISLDLIKEQSLTFNYFVIDVETNTVEKFDYVDLPVSDRNPIPMGIGILDNGTAIVMAEQGLGKIVDGHFILLGIPEPVPEWVDVEQTSVYAVTEDYIYALGFGVYASVILRMNLNTLETDAAVIQIGINQNTSIPISGHSLKVDGQYLWATLVGQPYYDDFSNIIIPEQRTLLCRLDLNTMVWGKDSSIGGSPFDVWDAPDMYQQGVSLASLITYGQKNVSILGSGDTGNSLAKGLIVHAPENENPSIYSHIRYMGKADYVEIPVILGGMYGKDYGATWSAGSVSNKNGYTVHLIASTGTMEFQNQEYMVYSDQAETNPTGRAIYESGVGFKSIFYDANSGRFRYYMDTGAFLEFDKEGNLIAKGEKGDPGRDGETGAKGEKGDGIQTIIPYYLVSEQETGITSATTGWTTTPQQTTDTNKYLWSYVTTQYTDGTQIDSNPVVIGTKGEKGDKGDKGDTGVAAIISDASATVNNNTGTPSVTVALGGTESDRTFDFIFDNIKGEKGDQGEKGEKGDKGDSIPIDSALSSSSTNAVQNKVVTAYFDNFALKNGSTSDFQANTHFFKSLGGWNAYERIAIPILEITSAVADDRYSNGKIFSHRNNGLYSDPYIEWYCNKSYSSTASEKYSLKVISINLFDVAEFSYNGKKYLGVIWNYTDSQSHYCYFDGYSNITTSPLFTTIPYYTNRNNSVLNSEIYNSLKIINAPQANAPAIGHVYIQFRGQSAPADLYPGTTWTNISSTYAGRFFRAEGGSAAAFGNTQAGGLPNITGGIEFSVWQGTLLSASCSGAFVGDNYGIICYPDGGGDMDGGNKNRRAYLNASRSSSLYGAASEVRPVNETFRIWKRTG